MSFHCHAQGFCIQKVHSKLKAPLKGYLASAVLTIPLLLFPPAPSSPLDKMVHKVSRQQLWKANVCRVHCPFLHQRWWTTMSLPGHSNISSRSFGSWRGSGADNRGLHLGHGGGSGRHGCGVREGLILRTKIHTLHFQIAGPSGRLLLTCATTRTATAALWDCAVITNHW